MQQTPFYEYHQKHDAKFVDFAGWKMPISYGSIIAEHQQVRKIGGLFDVSHMGRFEIAGRHARKFLERVLTRRVSDMGVKTCRYALICNPQGGVMDDVLVYRFDKTWLLVVNASNCQKIWDHLNHVIETQDFVVKLNDKTKDTAMVALQGPKVMEQIGQFSKEVPTLKRYSFCEKNLLILKMTISRTGYTGEDGVEIMMNASMAQKAIKLLIKDKQEQNDDDKSIAITPCGLGARDTLRMEAAMPLYGHELSESIDPLSAGLQFAVDLDKDQDERGTWFIGQEALQTIAKQGPKQVRIGLKLEGKRTPRQSMQVLKNDQVVGLITSGCLSPTLGYPIAMAYVQTDAATCGNELEINLGKQAVKAQVVALPFYKHP